MSVRALLLALLLPFAAQAQGFAGLGAAAEGFAVPQEGVAFEFPPITARTRITASSGGT